MLVFVTGASGFIGSHVTKELIEAGHQVLGLARSDASAAKVLAAGGQVLRGDITDLEILREGSMKCDSTVHLAFNHDFSRMALSAREEVAAIRAMAEAGKPLVITSGLMSLSSKPLDENFFHESVVFPRIASEHAAEAAAKTGTPVALVRLSQVHDTTKFGIITYLIQIARQKGRSVYINSSETVWSAAHVTDIARLYRLAVEKLASEPPAYKIKRYHGVAEVAIPLKDIAIGIGETLGLPTVGIEESEAEESFGPFARFARASICGTSEITQKELSWKPIGPKLLQDLKNYSS